MHPSRLAIALVLLACAAPTVLGCGSRSDVLGDSDCLAQGTCECRGPEDCPPGQPCINGKCGLPNDGGVLLGFGDTCADNAQCASGFCVPAADGDHSVCTRMCTGSCPDGWDCKVRVGERNVSLCAQHVDKLCDDCSVDGHCNPAFGDYCLTQGGLQSCGRDCNYGSCPGGYRCSEVEVGGRSAKQCVPEAGTCACTAQTVGLARDCSEENSFGMCAGQRVCQKSGDWSQCSARTPSAEVCNGLDDDCNGLVDAEDPGVDVSELPSSPPFPACRKGVGGACEGRWACTEGDDGYGWECAALDPQEELCDGLDNNCDGTVDEPFLDAEGRYVQPEHCGSCAIDCTKVLTNVAVDADGKVADGALSCELREGKPVCVPHQCGPGYYPYPEDAPVMCHPLASPQCRPCSTATDCSVPEDRCVVTGKDASRACLQGCGVDAPYPGCTGEIGAQGCCPDQATCRLVDGAAACVPNGDSCECDAEHLGVARSCIITGQQGAKCTGTQACELDPAGSYTWASCKAQGTTEEVCDGKDNDCDEVIDNGFISVQGSGTYDTDHHCGACNSDCLAQWHPVIQHAVGGCVASPSVTPHCEIVACTTARVGGGSTCQRDATCPAGWTCNPLYYQCTRACETSSDCLGGTCQDGWCTATCTTHAQCIEKFGLPSNCIAGVCQIEYRFSNADGVESNGCECPAAINGIDDSPDLYPVYPEAGWPNVDRNCDGIDGLASWALFVWNGSTQSLGTRQNPYRTIKEAIQAFDPTKHRQILVAAGQYDEAVDLKDGTQLYGGYAPDFSERDIVGYPTLLVGPEPDFSNPNYPRGVVNIVGAKSKRTVVAGFAIYGFDVAEQANSGEAGRSTYAVYIRDSSDVVMIANNLIFGGRGGDGGHGPAGTAGAAGGPGKNGLNSKECNSASCAGETQPGGAAGTNPACGSAAGNAGAGANGSINPQAYNPATGLNGRGGSNATYSSQFAPQYSHLCKYDCMIEGDVNGLDAQSGGNGQSGSAGQACTSGVGTISGGEWRAAAAGPGASGTAARGGGGGGAGGCVKNENPSSCTEGNRVGDLGATAGGGGAGGCGGAGGRAGGSGGASFAVMIAFASAPGSAVPRVVGNIVYIGYGGDGGDGGYGGHGGLGGSGGNGGVTIAPAWCGGYGGKGGRGGDGGPGGGAGGGCGGVAFGVAGNFITSASFETFNSFVKPAGSSGGYAGAGGPSPAGGAGNGSAGTNGASGIIHVY